MPDYLTDDELQAEIAKACRTRKWRPPKRRRLQKIRDAGWLPKAIPFYEKGRRGASYRYEVGTVAAYIRAEELRRANGGKLPSRKLVAQRERLQVVREWLAQPNLPVPRGVIGDELEAWSRLFAQAAPALYPYLQCPVSEGQDERLEAADTAIDSTLDTSGLDADTRDLAEALLRMLIFRKQDGSAEHLDLDALLAAIFQQAGRFARVADGVDGLCRLVRDVPINGLLVRPRALLETVTDEEFRTSARMTMSLAAALERAAKLAKFIVADLENARVERAKRNEWFDARADWCKPVVKAAALITRFLHSEQAPWLLCAIALVNVWCIRANPKTQVDVASMTADLTVLASTAESRASLKQ